MTDSREHTQKMKCLKLLVTCHGNSNNHKNDPKMFLPSVCLIILQRLQNNMLKEEGKNKEEMEVI